MKNAFLSGGSVVTAEGQRREDIVLEENAIRFGTPAFAGLPETDVRGKLLFPGFIDMHTHNRTPGHEYKGNIESETASALAGGITTVGDMPNTDPPTVTIANFSDKVRMALEQSSVDIRLFFGMTKREHLEQFMEFVESRDEVIAKLREWFVAVKFYFENSTGNQKIDWDIVGDAFRFNARHGILSMGHCEDAGMNAQAERAHAGINRVHMHSVNRPPESEAKSIATILRLVEETGARFHVAHISTRVGLDLLRKAKERKLPVTGEATTHHLFCTTDDYETLGTRIKMNPPIRSADDRDALWEGIADGTIDMVVTDHAPHTIEEKNHENPLKAPSGVPGVETMIPLLLSVAADHWPHPTSRRPEHANLSYQDIRRLCFDNPNRIFDLRKQDILDGSNADIVIVDPDNEWVIEAEKLHSKCGWTPYEGWSVRGKIDRVLQAR